MTSKVSPVGPSVHTSGIGLSTPVQSPLPQPLPLPPSNFRRVFQGAEEMKADFADFLQTIFYQLDSQKVMERMEALLADPKKTDEEIYRELSAEIGEMKRRFAPLWQIWSLRVLKEGMGAQAKSLLKTFQGTAFRDYMEIYDRRYLNVIRRVAALRGNTIAVSDRGNVTPLDRIQAGALASRYPYKTHVPLNDPECQDPLEHPEQTHKPIGNEVPDRSVDLISCLGGLHHVPAQRLKAFVASLHRTLRPGGVILLRDHDVTSDRLRTVASLVHTFVNAADGVSWNVEANEVRNFKSMDEWAALMKAHGFTRVSPDTLILPGDPTGNGMTAFVRAPLNLEELREATAYRNDCARSKNGTFATWIEWGDVRASKEYAAFVQTHHAYAFDSIGHLRQHFQHFSKYLKHSRELGLSFKEILFSGDFAMNFFILTAAFILNITRAITSLPSALFARLKHGKNWRSVANLTDLEKREAAIELEYSTFIDHTPFYCFDYLGKIKEIWRTVMASKEGFATKVASAFSATASSASLLLKALVSLPIRKIYTSEANLEPSTIKVLLRDPENELPDLIARWEREKDPVQDAGQTIEVIHRTPDGHALVSMPRYRPFTRICGLVTQTRALQMLEAGGQKALSIDVLLEEGIETPQVEDVPLLYEMEKLQDPERRRYATYLVALPLLGIFECRIGRKRIEYVHE